MLEKLKIKIATFLEDLLHRYIIEQIKGYIDREVGKGMAATYGLDIGFRSTHHELEVFIKDPKYCSEYGKDPIQFKVRSNIYKIQNKLRIAHYYYYDTFWLLLNLKEECYKLNLDVTHYARTNGFQPLTNEAKNKLEVIS